MITTICLHISVQDTTDKCRINESTIIEDLDFVIPSCRTYVRNSSLISYDKETKTAIYEVIAESDTSPDEKTATILIRGFLESIKYDLNDTHINIKDILNSNALSVPLSNFNYIGGSLHLLSSDYEDAKNAIHVLTPDMMNIYLKDDIEHVYITNIGFVNGKLHVQVKWEHGIRNSFVLSIRDKYGNIVKHDNYNFYADSDNRTGDNRSEHVEYVFDISETDDLSDYLLYAGFTKDGQYTTGRWNVNFRLGKSETIIMNYVSINDIADYIEISPLSVLISEYKGEVSFDEFKGPKIECEIYVFMKDGAKISFNGHNVSAHSEDGRNFTYSIRVKFESPININDVTSVMINGVNIPVSR